MIDYLMEEIKCGWEMWNLSAKEGYAIKLLVKGQNPVKFTDPTIKGVITKAYKYYTERVAPHGVEE